MATIADLRALLPADRFPNIELDQANFLVGFRRQIFRIPLTSVDEYLEAKEQIVRPQPTSIFYPGYYECLVERIGSLTFGIGLAGRLRDQPIRLEKVDGSATVEVSPASVAFALAMMTDFDQTLGRRSFGLGTLGLARSREEQSSFEQFFSRILTVKVQDFAAFDPDELLREIAEAALFNLAYGGKVLLTLLSSWDRGRQHIRRGRMQDVQFPRRAYNSDLVSYYRLGLGSDSVLLSYLAFYKIIEHFFPIVTEKGLQQRMVEKLVAPEFSHTKAAQLRQLATIVRKYDQRMDEEKMLAAVVEQFFAVDEIRDLVARFEGETRQYYTTPQRVLGQNLSLDLNAEQMAPSLAKRIYHIRNALVHNKEGEVARFIPYSGQEAVLLAEIPIVQFLAEQLIVRSGRDLD